MKTMKHVLCWMLVAAMVFGMMPVATFATESEVVGRETVSLNGEWQFTDGDTTTTVTVPHSWGDNPEQVTKTCYYERDIDVAGYEGKDLFLYFEAVAKIANVYIDDVLIGTHKGGYYAFAMDITDACAGKDSVHLKVEVTNIDMQTIPMFSDFTFFGGIYRDAWLVAVDPAAYISNEDYGSNGLYVLPEVDLETGAAAVNSTVMVTNEEEAVVEVEILDAEGTVVASAEKTVEAGYVQEVVLDEIVIENAHLWQGIFDPYLYTVKATVSVDGVELDCVEDEIGLRTFEVVDGVSYGNGTLEQDCVFVWSGIQLKKNETVKVEAIGTKDGEVVYTDTIDTWYWSVAAEIESDSNLNKVYDGEPVAEPEYTVTVEGEDITDEAEVTIEWYKVVEGTDDESENPGYEGGTPDYDTGSNPGSGDILDDFVDADQIAPYALEAMRWAVENGLVIGDDTGRLDPQGSVERIELATFLKRWCEDIAPDSDLPYYP